MTRARAIGGGHYGEPLTLVVIPDSTFATEIAALIAAGTEVEGKLVGWVTSGNYTVTSPADNAIPDGQIVAYETDADNSYVLTCDFWSYSDVESTLKPAICVRHLPYNDGTIALGQQVQVYGSTYVYVDGVNTGGGGKVIAKDVVSGYVDVLF